MLMQPSVPRYKKIITNLPIKIISLIIGYGIWFSVSHSHRLELSLKIPICFYGTKTVTHAPELLYLSLAGKRDALYCLQADKLALHVNTDTLSSGQHHIHPDHTNLFLPETIEIRQCIPSNISITIG